MTKFNWTIQYGRTSNENEAQLRMPTRTTKLMIKNEQHKNTNSKIIIIIIIIIIMYTGIAAYLRAKRYF